MTVGEFLTKIFYKINKKRKLLTERKKGTKQDEEYTEEGYNIDSSH